MAANLGHMRWSLTQWHQLKMHIRLNDLKVERLLHRIRNCKVHLGTLTVVARGRAGPLPGRAAVRVAVEAKGYGLRLKLKAQA